MTCKRIIPFVSKYTSVPALHNILIKREAGRLALKRPLKSFHLNKQLTHIKLCKYNNLLVKHGKYGMNMRAKYICYIRMEN
jgi:hypothetical protein